MKNRNKLKVEKAESSEFVECTPNITEFLDVNIKVESEDESYESGAQNASDENPISPRAKSKNRSKKSRISKKHTKKKHKNGKFKLQTIKLTKNDATQAYEIATKESESKLSDDEDDLKLTAIKEKLRKVKKPLNLAEDSSSDTAERKPVERPPKKKRKRQPMPKTLHCPHCSHVTTTMNNLSRHLLTHNPEKTIPCNICGMKFSQIQYMKTHRRRHSNTTRHKCDVCHKEFTRLDNLRRHRALHDEVKPFGCELCEFTDLSVDVVVDHVPSHKESHECSLCGKRLQQAIYLINHIASHSENRPFECPICGLSFYREDTMGIHIQSHVSTRAFPCEVCNRRFARRHHLEIHALSHTDERPYPCDRCDARFKHTDTLKKHQQRHDNPKGFECMLCNKFFTNKTSLKLHGYLHTGEKPYKCEMCDRSFIQFRSYLSHKVAHHTEGPFECARCPRAFVTMVAFNKHLESHEGEPPIEEPLKQKRQRYTVITKPDVPPVKDANSNIPSKTDSAPTPIVNPFEPKKRGRKPKAYKLMQEQLLAAENRQLQTSVKQIENPVAQILDPKESKTYTELSVPVVRIAEKEPQEVSSIRSDESKNDESSIDKGDLLSMNLQSIFNTHPASPEQTKSFSKPLELNTPRETVPSQASKAPSPIHHRRQTPEVRLEDKMAHETLQPLRHSAIANNFIDNLQYEENGVVNMIQKKPLVDSLYHKSYPSCGQYRSDLGSQRGYTDDSTAYQYQERMPESVPHSVIETIPHRPMFNSLTQHRIHGSIIHRTFVDDNQMISNSPIQNPKYLPTSLGDSHHNSAPSKFGYENEQQKPNDLSLRLLLESAPRKLNFGSSPQHERRSTFEDIPHMNYKSLMNGYPQYPLINNLHQRSIADESRSLADEISQRSDILQHTNDIANSSSLKSTISSKFVMPHSTLSNSTLMHPSAKYYDPDLYRREANAAIDFHISDRSMPKPYEDKMAVSNMILENNQRYYDPRKYADLYAKYDDNVERHWSTDDLYASGRNTASLNTAARIEQCIRSLQDHVTDSPRNETYKKIQQFLHNRPD